MGGAGGSGGGGGILTCMKIVSRRGLVVVAVVVIVAVGIYGWRTGPAPVPPAFDPSVTLAEAGERSARTGRPVLVLATADWCGPCQMFKRGPMADPAVTEAVRTHFEPVYLDVDADAAAARQLGVAQLPSTIVLSEGQEESRIEGYLPAPDVLAWLGRHAVPPGAQGRTP